MEDELAKRRQIQNPVVRQQTLLELGFSEGVIKLIENLAQPEKDDWFAALRRMSPTIVARMNGLHAKMEREMNNDVGSKG